MKFDFFPPAGTHDFDVIATTGAIANNATLSVEGLPSNFQIVSFGVVDVGNGDVLRLTIDGDPCPGDVDSSGAVDLADLLTVFANFGRTADVTFATGDTDLDGDVELDDLLTVLSDFGTGC